MKKHKKIYIEYFNFSENDFIPCEVCGAPAVDIHHISARGMGGSKNKDNIENLMAVCRNCHIKYGDKKKYLNFLITKHAKYINK